MNLLRKIGGMALLLLLPMGVSAQTSSVAEKEMTVAERNTAQGFNDTIDRTADDFVTVSLVVADPGEVLYSTLGHAALHLQCPTFNLDYIFTYESENVREKIWTFLKGNLKMGMFALTPEEFLDSYRLDGRGVKEYTLNLSPEQKQNLWRVMDNHVLEGANLPYDYFHRGCAKSVVQVIHEAIGKRAIHYAPWSDKYTKHTTRELGCIFVPISSWERFILFFLVGSEFDKSYPCEQKLIVPTDLVEVWQDATLDNGKPVLDRKERVLMETPNTIHGTWCTPLLVSVLLCILALLSLLTVWFSNRTIRIAGEVIDYSLLTLYTLIGAGMTYLILFSGLPCTNWNWLIIPFNILPVLGWHWRRYWALPYAIVCAVWVIGMLAWPHWIVDWPHIILVCSFVIMLVKQFVVTSQKK